MNKLIDRLTTIEFSISRKRLSKISDWWDEKMLGVLVLVLSILAVGMFWFYLSNGLGLAYNDARSHLDIGRRVVEGLKPGLAQLGSVWLPLPHLLMVPTIWNDFMWHSGLSGSIQSMAAFVATAVLVYAFLRKLGIGLFGRLFGVVVFVVNLNVLYLQSTAMTELLLLSILMAACYYLLSWFEDQKLVDLLKTAGLVMLSSLIRYEGWFLLVASSGLIGMWTLVRGGYKKSEGMVILFGTLAGLGIGLWLLWNLLIFKDPLYFAFGPFSAHAQQDQLEAAGNLATKYNLLLSFKVYMYALIYNTYASVAAMGLLGVILFWTDKKIKPAVKVASLALLAPLAFNILALFLGHSVLFIQGIAGNTWFNVRYGIMMAPAVAIFSGYLVERLKRLRWLIVGVTMVVLAIAVAGGDAVTIDDARVGSSQKNVSEVSGWLRENASGDSGYVLISAASHDAIIFSSGLPMKRFIHEGTGKYWLSATAAPDRWAKYIIMRTHDTNDLTFKLVSQTDALDKYTLVDTFPFADIYELKPEYWGQLETTIADPEIR